MARKILTGRIATVAAMVVAVAVPFPAAGWEPTKPVEFIVPIKASPQTATGQ